jgi:hypothetical protein
MGTSIASFLAKGSGPRRMRIALRTKIAPLSATLRAAKALQVVRTRTPQILLGGDLVGLLSDRLRALLEGGEGDAASPDIRPSYTRFAEHAAATGAAAPRLLANSESFQRRASGAAALAAVLERGSSPAPPEEQCRHSPHALRDLQIDPPPAGDAALIAALDTRRPSAVGVGASASQHRVDTTPPPLVKKLREYWELSQTSPAAERAIAGSVGEETRGEAPATPSHPPRPVASARQSWPESTARQLARRARAAVADPSSARTMQLPDSAATERTEIRNIFNIEVKSEGGDFTDDLSERLSEILLEQALQHGIDVT